MKRVSTETRFTNTTTPLIRWGNAWFAPVRNAEKYAGIITDKNSLQEQNAATGGGLNWHFGVARGCILKLVGCVGRKNFISQREKQKEREWQNEKERWRARERYWQTLLFNRAAQIQTQTWPVIGGLRLGLGMGCSDSCLEMMEAPEKGDGEERDHDNKTKITVKFCCPSPVSPNSSDRRRKKRDHNKSTTGEKIKTQAVD